MKKTLLVLGGWLFISGFCFTASANDEPPLNGAIVRPIAQRFVEMHYSQQPLDDVISVRMFQIYMNLLDPGHYYFMEADINEFRRYEKSLDDLIQQGNIEIALQIFTRFKTRLNERLQMTETFIKEDFDFKKDATWELDRKDVPYPKDQKDAQSIWRTKMKFDLLQLTLGGSTMEEAKERLLKRIRSAWKDYSHYKDNDVVSLYMNALTSAYDPHSSYLSPQELKNFDITIKLSLEGIGAVLRWEDGYTVVNSIVPGGAAYRDGRLKVNDRIIGVAQGTEPFESVIDMRLNDVVQLIRGERGTKVRLQIIRKNETGNSTVLIEILRDQIVLKDGEAQAEVFTPTLVTETGKPEATSVPKKIKVGVINLPSFYIDFNGRRENPDSYKSSSRDVATHLETFKKQNVDGVILDLRNNGGGGLDEAISMAGLFVGANPVVIVNQSGGRQYIHRSREKAVYEGPLLVLLSRFSASASEILAGALQDYHRAILVGDKTTFGKGTVQNIAQLPEDYGALKITIAQFYRVSGWSTQNRGVESDIVLPSITNEREIGESTLPNALPWKSIDAVNYAPVSKVDKYLPQLRKHSQERTKNSEFFQKIQKNIQEYVTQIKPRKYTSILEIQKDYEKRDEPKPETETIEGEIPEHADSQETKSIIVKDQYLEESIQILEDYIQMLQVESSRKTQIFGKRS
ncbi:MAG: carboxy terminal-processing peptidase [SAR324 cluster bacterium]|nr:carboxy terminal-processing peptidase [SAR324 cluster bacterium]